MKKIETAELRGIQIGILDIFVQYCKENDLKYFLCGGTLIGAVRHKGYIPWDDDIDVALLREDYEKFVQGFNGYNKNFEVFTAKSNMEYPYPFTKISYNKTLLKENIDEINSLRIGVNIDVFPIDAAPDDKEEQLMLIKQVNTLRNKLNFKLIKINEKRKKHKNMILWIGKKIYKSTKPVELSLKINELVKNYEKIGSQYSGIMVWGYGLREIVNKEIFNDVVQMKFEAKYYDVPIGYDDWLTHVYGKYMEFPPKEKQISHHAFEAFWKNNEGAKE